MGHQKILSQVELKLFELYARIRLLRKFDCAVETLSPAPDATFTPRLLDRNSSKKLLLIDNVGSRDSLACSRSFCS